MTGVIIQIQASITSEAIDNLGLYEENAKKSKRIQIYKIEHKLPLKPSHTDGKHQVPPPPVKQQNKKHQGV
jgi:hypothetical protein